MGCTIWCYFEEAFVSVVCPREGDGAPGLPLDPDRLMIRARVRKHLEALQDRFERLREYRILTTPHNDYGFRIIIPKALWAEVMAALVTEIDYGNFKRAAEEKRSTGKQYLDVLHQVWRDTLRLQRAEGR